MQSDRDGRSWRRRLRWLALPLVGVALVTAAEWLGDRDHEAQAAAVDWTKAAYGPRSYAEAMKHTANQLDLGHERVRNGPSQWLRQESLARAFMDRARISYTYDELAQAGTVLSKARAMAPDGSGPLLTDAVYGQMVHQLQRTQDAVRGMDRFAVRSDRGDLAEIASLKGDVAFYRGDFAGAMRDYREAGRYGASGGLAFRLARMAKAKGEFDAAIRHFEEADPAPTKATPFANANTALQIGAVEQARGNYRKAVSWFTIADRQFPGYWLIEAHLAQSKAVAGDLQGAIGDLTTIAQKAPSAEVLDTLAMLLRANGQAAESRKWADRAGAIWQRRLDQLPSAAYGHAVEHQLMFGTPKRAIKLARANLASRPYGESRLLLASALLADGQMDAALGQLDATEKSGWRSAPLYALRAQALELLGRQDDAKLARKEAMALNPRIFAPETSLIWLSHG